VTKPRRRKLMASEDGQLESLETRVAAAAIAGNSKATSPSPLAER
jgi:hypothetical protein